MGYSIEISSSAEKYLIRLNESIRNRILDALIQMSMDPLSGNVKKLKGRKNCYRRRIGNLRILFEIHRKQLIVLIVDIGWRGDIYK